MSLAPGTRISSYEIIDILGTGAMGSVYRARDTSLGRDVAVKVLPEEFAKDAERLGRFEREARLLAQLNHPGIAGVYGLEAEGDDRFIVMELVPGETLGAHIARGPIAWREAVAIAVQLADALDAAHEAGIVHRDLKPDNVAVTQSDTAKLLDFGLGKPMTEELQRAVGSSRQMTQAGAILGTPAYISPEQFHGKPVDRRADIWAFGCLLYEMSTGTAAFPGDTVGEIAAGVLKNEPDWSALPTGAPQELSRLVRDCLEKDPRERLRDIGEARRALERMLSGKHTVAIAPAAVSKRCRSVAWPIVATLTVIALAAGLLVGRSIHPAGDGASAMPGVAYHVPLPPGTDSLQRVFLSSDGTTLGFLLKDEQTRTGTVWLRERLSTPLLLPRRVPTTERATAACLSPDGGAIAFVRDETLYRLDRDTGVVTRLCRCRDYWSGGLSWGNDARILFAETSETAQQVMRVVDADGGEPRALNLREGGVSARHEPTWVAPGPAFLALTEYALPSSATAGFTPRQLVLYRPAAPPIAVCESDSAGWPVADCLLYRVGTKLLARPFDPDSGSTGDPVPVADDVRAVCATRNGVLAFQGGMTSNDSQLTWVYAADFTESEIGDPGDIDEANPSPVDDRIAVTLWTGIPKTMDLWILGAGGQRERLTDREGAFGAAWSPDGTKIAYTGTSEGRCRIFWRAADGSGEPQYIVDGSNVHDWSPDGQWLCYSEAVDANAIHFRWVGDIAGSNAAPPEERVRQFKEKLAFGGSFFPDGKWITYASGQGKDRAAYVRPFAPSFGARQLISGGQGGDFPAWSPTANEIVFIRGDRKAMRVRLEEGGNLGLNPTPPEDLFELRAEAYNRAFEYSHDGKRILANRLPKPNLSPVTVIVGWEPPEKQK